MSLGHKRSLRLNERLSHVTEQSLILWQLKREDAQTQLARIRYAVVVIVFRRFSMFFKNCSVSNPLLIDAPSNLENIFKDENIHVTCLIIIIIIHEYQDSRR